MGLALIGISLLKVVSTTWINYKIVSFGQNQDARLRPYSMQIYQAM